MADGAARAVQEMFPALADAHLAEIREVLRSSEDESQRAMAAYVLVYATRKSGIVNDLQYALRDADSGVRTNAARTRVALSVLAKLEPAPAVASSAPWRIGLPNAPSYAARPAPLGPLH